MKTKNIDIIDELVGAEFLGCGASKEAYLKDNIVYKIPRGRYNILIDKNNFNDIYFPEYNINELEKFIGEVYELNSSMVWVLGQFASEIIVWNCLKKLEKQGTNINCFGRIIDYYKDKNGIIVIEQENLTCSKENIDSQVYEELYAEVNKISQILYENFGISLSDIRSGNCGSTYNNKLKIFDFGLSEESPILNYGDYSNEKYLEGDY